MKNSNRKITFAAHRDDPEAVEFLYHIYLAGIDSVETIEIGDSGNPEREDVLLFTRPGGGIHGMLVAKNVFLSSPFGTQQYFNVPRQVVICPGFNPMGDFSLPEDVARKVALESIRRYHDDHPFSPSIFGN